MMLELLAVAAAVTAPQEMAPAQDFGPQAVSPRGSYSRSCSGDYVNRGRLYADCRDNRGQVRGTSIELNRCSDYDISNNNGLLVCGPYRGDYEDRRPDRPDRPGGGWGDGGWGGRDGIIVYRDSYFRGASRTFNGAVPDLSREGFNDTISSVQLRGEWTLCTDANFRGNCQTFTDAVIDLSRYGLNDRVTSMRPGRHDGGGWPGGGGGRDQVEVYRDSDFRGESRTFSGEQPDLGRSGFNDAISSMRFRGEWEACTDAYFRGFCQTFNDDIRNLSSYGMNDRISSLRPLRRGGR